MADIANFINSFNGNTSHWVGTTPHEWVVIGGSYPGALSAWFHARYPELTVAAWSSSAVIQPIVNFT